MTAGQPTALEGLRVLDFTRVLAGPYCTLMLSDLGAEVIKVENPAGGDETRRFLPPDVEGESTYFLHVNRNKKSVVLDLSKPEGKAAALALAAKADVLVENFRPGVMARLGLDYQSIKADNPRIVYCSISGYGTTGPLATRAGLDPVIQAECGLMALTGEPDGQPMRIGVSLVDAMTGLFASQTILAALTHRGMSGLGQQVEVSLFDTGVNMLVNFASSFLMAGVEPGRPGNGNLVSQPAGLFEASDGSFVVTCASDAAFVKFCEGVLKAPELAGDPRFKTNRERLTNQAALTAELNARLSTNTRDAWIKRMREVGVPGGEVRTVAQALTSEEFHARDMITEVEHPTAGVLRMLRPPMLMAGTPIRAPAPAPLFGEHTETVLRDIAGYDNDGIGCLRDAGVIP
jgi:crotonobetainyl-CoA:carnitine CoA-transferase CaiB-like acyl-CoA transferase